MWDCCRCRPRCHRHGALQRTPSAHPHRPAHHLSHAAALCCVLPSWALQEDWDALEQPDKDLAATLPLETHWAPSYSVHPRTGDCACCCCGAGLCRCGCRMGHVLECLCWEGCCCGHQRWSVIFGLGKRGLLSASVPMLPRSLSGHQQACRGGRLAGKQGGGALRGLPVAACWACCASAPESAAGGAEAPRRAPVPTHSSNPPALCLCLCHAVGRGGLNSLNSKHNY